MVTKKKKTARTGASELGPKPVKSGEYAELLKDSEPLVTRAYDVEDSFSPEEAIEHPVFGVGFVRELKAGNKLDVLFEDGARIMVHSRKR